MSRVGLGIVIGALGAVTMVGACALDESGVASDSGIDVVGVDAKADAGFDAPQNFDADAQQQFDVPDLGVGETESGLPCTCVPTPPNGYNVIEYVPDQRPGCTTGYGTQKDFIENPTAAPSTCACTCSAAPTNAPQCSCGANPATFNISSGNGDCNGVKGETLVANVGSCYKTGQPLNPNGQNLNNMLAAPATPCAAAGGTCGGPTKTQTFPPPTANQGRACVLTAATAACTGGTCIPTQGTPFGLCITNGTLDPCPSSFPVTHVAGNNPIVDTRSCGPNVCGCSIVDGGSCGVPQLTLYSGDNNCGGNGSSVTLPADNTTCTAAGYGNGTTFDSARYTVTQNGGTCGFAGTFNAMGSLGVTGPANICCHP